MSDEQEPRERRPLGWLFNQHQPEPVTGLPGPVAYQRAVDLLDQAFATRVVQDFTRGVGAAGDIVSVLPPDERDRYIAAAQAYATLAQTAATAEAVAARGPGDLDPSWRPVLGWADQTEPPL
jgi:hypothetical protein